MIINPIKATTVDVEGAVRRIAAEDGWQEPLVIETTEEDPGHGQARQALDAGVDLVIAAGGDGTVRCVAEELAESGTLLALVPLGTGNLLARNLDIAVDDPDAAVEAAFRGTERSIDIVHVTVDRAQDAHVFLVMAGIGYDAAIMSDTRDDLKDKVGWLAYVDAGIRNLPGKPTRTTISVDGGKPFERRLRSVMGGNCGKIMGGLEIFPGAKIDDGLMDLMTVAPRGRWAGWRSSVSSSRGERARIPRSSTSSAAPQRSPCASRWKSSSTAIPSGRRRTWRSRSSPIRCACGCRSAIRTPPS